MIIWACRRIPCANILCEIPMQKGLYFGPFRWWCNLKYVTVCGLLSTPCKWDVTSSRGDLYLGFETNDVNMGPFCHLNLVDLSFQMIDGRYLFWVICSRPITVPYTTHDHREPLHDLWWTWCVAPPLLASGQFIVCTMFREGSLQSRVYNIHAYTPSHEIIQKVLFYLQNVTQIYGDFGCFNISFHQLGIDINLKLM